jgi:hypothetical protein
MGQREYYISSLTDNNIFSFSHFALKKIGVAKKSTKKKSKRLVFHFPKKSRKNTDRNFEAVL